MQLDPEEIFGSAFLEAFKRAFIILACLFTGNTLAVLGALCVEVFFSCFPFWHTDFLPRFNLIEWTLMPFWVFSTPFMLLAAPNYFAIIFYYVQSEEPTRKRFILFTALNQFSMTATLHLWSFQDWGLETILSSISLWFCSAALFALFLYVLKFIHIKRRIGHEEHLMAVAAENEEWRRSLEDAIHVPPPPKGPESPKARPLSDHNSL